MAKDPAVLLYTADFLVGVITMTDEQTGKYIRLLCLQHQRGHLSEADMRSVCREFDETIYSKFLVDEEGRYYNRRMDEEIRKRVKSTDSSRENGKKGGRAKNQPVSSGLPEDVPIHNPQVQRKEPNDNPQVNFNEPSQNPQDQKSEPKRNPSENEDEDVNENENTNGIEDVFASGTTNVRHKHGKYGWVLLTDGEYQKLHSDLGELELLRCIAYIDESAQSSGNKNKWKDWNVVLRRCSKGRWGARSQPPSSKADAAMNDLRELHAMFGGE